MKWSRRGSGERGEGQYKLGRTRNFSGDKNVKAESISLFMCLCKIHLSPPTLPSTSAEAMASAKVARNEMLCSTGGRCL